jgi:ABC-type taurine transport system substrate-binding protein
MQKDDDKSTTMFAFVDGHAKLQYPARSPTRCVSAGMEISNDQVRFVCVTPKLFSLRVACRVCSLSFIFAVLSVVTAGAETKNVRIMMDWIIQGTHAPFFVAQDKGYFKEQGVTVDAIDAGKGATNVAVAVAGGVYQFGWVDLPSMIRFNAANPASPLLAVYMSFDASPLAVITRKDAGIRKPMDLDGKKIAGGPGTAVHDTISILLKAANAESVKINWVAVQPQLFGPMLKRGEVDGTGGFTTRISRQRSSSVSASTICSSSVRISAPTCTGSPWSPRKNLPTRTHRPCGVWSAR